MPAPAHPSKAPEVSAAEIQNRKDFLDQIQQYFHQNNVSVTVEDAINQVALERPTDCYGAMSKVFSRKSKNPVITDVKFQPSVDSQGTPAVSVILIAEYKGSKIFGKSFYPFSLLNPVAEEPGSKPKTAGSSAGGAGAQIISPSENVKSLEPVIQGLLKGVDSSQVDDLLVNNDKLDLFDPYDCQIISVVSLANASLLGQMDSDRTATAPFTYQLAKPLSSWDPQKFRFVIPLVCANSRVKFQDISIIINPNEVSIVELAGQLPTLQQNIAAAMEQSKTKDKKAAVYAELSPKEQAAAQAAGLIIPGTQFGTVKDLLTAVRDVLAKDTGLGKKCRLGIRFDGSASFDDKENVYGIHENEKLSPDDFVTSIKTLCTELPELVLVDNFLSDVAPIPAQGVGKTFKNAELFFGSTIALASKRLSVSLLHQNTVSKLKSTMKQIGPELTLLEIIPSDSPETTVDMAVTLGAEYLRIGPPSRPENVRAFNRYYELLSILK